MELKTKNMDKKIIELLKLAIQETRERISIMQEKVDTLEKKLEKLEKQSELRDTLLIDLRGKDAFDLHTSTKNEIL